MEKCSGIFVSIYRNLSQKTPFNAFIWGFWHLRKSFKFYLEKGEMNTKQGLGLDGESRQEFLMFHVKHDFYYDLLFY